LSALMLILNILGITLLALIGLCLLFLIVPIRYKLDGGYAGLLWLNLELRCSPLIIVRGTIKSSPQAKQSVQLIILGIPITMHPEKWKSKKEKPEKEKKAQRKSKNRFGLLKIIDRDLRVRGMALAGDLLRILKPDKLEVNGKIGFDEPHLTGWLAAICLSLQFCCTNTMINVEPFWEEEHYDLSFLLEGRLMIGLILLKIGGFAISRWYYNTFSARKEKLNLS
jgi:hypothetical protein